MDRSRIDFTDLIKISEMKNYDIEDLDDQLKLAKEAKAFLLEHIWCKHIKEGWYDRGWADKLAVFLFQIIPDSENADEFVWIIVGDLPSAYIDILSASNGACAIEAYTNIMEDWYDNVLQGKSVENCYPIGVPPTKEYGQMLQSRVEFIRDEILTMFDDELEGC